LSTKIILKDRDAKPLIESLNRLSGLGHLSHKSRVEVEKLKIADVIFVDGEPVAFQRNGITAPVLVNEVALAGLPKIVVDMGAVPHVVGGADVMAPGVRAVKGEFGPGQLVVVVDEKHNKCMALGRSLLSSADMAETRKGKVVENLHYVGDLIWEAIKTKRP
jgi:PUA-domain protein